MQQAPGRDSQYFYIEVKKVIESDQVTGSVCLDYEVKCIDFYIWECCQESSVLPHGVHQRFYLVVSDTCLPLLSCPCDHVS